MEAIILAGGLGTRLGLVLPGIPKAMVPVAGRPFLEHLFYYLSEQGITKVVLSVGFLKEMIVGHFNDSFNGISITYAIEDQPLGTGGGVRLAMEKISSESSFVINGDTLFKVNLKQMRQHFESNHAKAVLALRYMPDTGRYGTVLFNPDYQITAFQEKQKSSIEGYINGGVYLVNKSFFMQHTAEGVFSMEKDFFEKKTGLKELYAFPTEAYFIDIGIPEDYERAQGELS